MPLMVLLCMLDDVVDSVFLQLVVLIFQVLEGLVLVRRPPAQIRRIFAYATGPCWCRGYLPTILKM